MFEPSERERVNWLSSMALSRLGPAPTAKEIFDLIRVELQSVEEEIAVESGSDAAAMTALLLRRLREASGTSLREVASRMGAASRNAYARYERGEAVPTVEKLDALVKAASAGGDFVIRQSNT